MLSLPFTLNCGSTNRTFISADVEQLIKAYECGQNLGQLVEYKAQHNAAATPNRPKRYGFLLTVMFMVLFASVVNASTKTNDVTVVKLDDKSVIISDLYRNWKNNNGTRYIKDKDTTITIDLDTYNDISGGDNELTLLRRDTWVPRGGSWTQTQAAQSGEWWSPWYPVSGCYYCDKTSSSTTCSQALGYTYTYTWSIAQGAGIDFGSVKTTTTLTISESWAQSSTYTCSWGSGSGPAQVWYQQGMYWADMQKQQCQMYYRVSINHMGQIMYTDGTTRCSAWSEYYRANAPIADKVNRGCSVGFQHTKC